MNTWGATIHGAARRLVPPACALVGYLLLPTTLGFLRAAPPAAPAAPAAESSVDDVQRDYAAELPRIAPREPADALSTFAVAPGFRMELVAAEPLVCDPVAMSFDEDGRLYVVEMRDYSEQADEHLGRVRLLVDTNEDGRFDESHLFADGLSWPTAIICYARGIFVGAAPDVLYLKDTDGDGRADQREVVFTGFHRTNVQGLLNSFQWGLDNRIHGATSSSGAEVRRPDDPRAMPVVLGGRDFAFDPRTREFRATSGGAQHGMSFDNWGRKFVCSNSDHIQQVMFDDHYVARNAFLAAPSARRSIAADGPQAEVFRTSPVEPWRVVRTRLRVKGVVPGPVEGGGRAAGYFTSATGVTIYRGDAWHEAYRGSAIVGDVGSNIVHRKVLEEHGIELTARRANDGSEFISSSDIWFRPVQFANAPDGALYIADMYREVIEHPLSLPPVIKKHLDLTSGRDRGRIYRVVPDDYRQRPLPRLASAPTAELVATLAHPNGWHRDTARRLLYERQDASAVDDLRQLAVHSNLHECRLGALYVLRGLDALTAEQVLHALHDHYPRVREHAVRLAEPLANEHEAVRSMLYSLVNDPDMRVRYQLAFTLGEITDDSRLKVLANMARRDSADPWIRLAILSSLNHGASEVFTDLAADAVSSKVDPSRNFLIDLARQIGARAKSDEIGVVIRSAEATANVDPAWGHQLLRTLCQALAASRGAGWRQALTAADAERIEPLVRDLLSAAQAKAADVEAPIDARIEAIHTLALGTFSDVEPILLPLLSSHEPQTLQAAALAALGTFDDVAAAAIIGDAWPSFTPSLRRQATEILFSRQAWLPALLDAVERGQINALDLEAARVKSLTEQADPTIAQRARQLFADVRLARRQDVVEAYRPAIGVSGDAERGRETFRRVCAACHKLEGVGHEMGPSLATIQNRGPEAILLNVLDPNREVNPQYLNYALVTDDGRTLTGILAAETATTVTLTRAEGQSDTVLRVRIDELRSTGLSIMPEGIEQQIDQAAMADLIAYLTSVQ